MIKKKNKELMMIDKISKSLSVTRPKERTLLEIETTEEKDTKLLRLKNGSWNSKKEPWLVLDEKQKLHALLSMDSLTKIVENFKQMEQETFSLKLEKSILQQLPLDFNDVWAVAMEEIKKQKKTAVDFDKVIKKIKKEHPNLFLNLQDFYLSEGVNVIQSSQNSKGTL